MSNLIVPAEANLTLPPSMQFRQVEKIGPVTVGSLLPWNGMMFHVTKIEANDNLDFKVTIEPGGPTKGSLKRVIGKNGKRNVKNMKNAKKARR